MIVIDASLIVDFLLNIQPRASRLARRLENESASLAVPHLLDAEVAQVLRRFVRGKEISVRDAEMALDDLDLLPLTRYAHTALLPRAFAWRENVTIYDGLYLALAEALAVPFLTGDHALAGIPKCAVLVEVIE